jgi:hypothetical protein
MQDSAPHTFSVHPGCVGSYTLMGGPWRVATHIIRFSNMSKNVAIGFTVSFGHILFYDSDVKQIRDSCTCNDTPTQVFFQCKQPVRNDSSSFAQWGAWEFFHSQACTSSFNLRRIHNHKHHRR